MPVLLSFYLGSSVSLVEGSQPTSLPLQCNLTAPRKDVLKGMTWPHEKYWEDWRPNGNQEFQLTYMVSMYLNGTHTSQLVFLAHIFSKGPSTLSHCFQKAILWYFLVHTHLDASRIEGRRKICSLPFVILLAAEWRRKWSLQAVPCLSKPGNNVCSLPLLYYIRWGRPL